MSTIGPMCSSVKPNAHELERDTSDFNRARGPGLALHDLRKRSRFLSPLVESGLYVSKLERCSKPHFSTSIVRLNIEDDLRPGKCRSRIARQPCSWSDR